MKTNAIIPCVALLCALSTQALARTPQAAPGQKAGDLQTPASSSKTGEAAPPKINPEKEADIRQLIKLTGGTKLASQMMDGMQKNMKPSLENAFPPGEYRGKLIDLFFEKFRSKADLQVLVDMSIPIYDKYLSEEDIKGLIQFYSTPLGQKALSVIPNLMIELQSEGMKWGQELGRQSMIEVLAEHPDLRKALQDASKNPKPN